MPPTPARARPQLGTAWLLFAGLSLAAVLIGCWVVSGHGFPSRTWALNPAAWVVGAAVAAGLSRAGLKLEPLWLAIGLAGLAATFLAPGLSGVHRWIGLGPVRLNSAELLLPPMIVALAGLAGRRAVSLSLMVAAMALLALQPDVSQAAAFAGASIVLLAASGGASVRGLAPGVLLAAIAVAAGFRPDPLAPVSQVEGVIQLAAAVSPAIAALAVVSLAGAALAPLVIVRRHPARPVLAAAYGLSAYFVLAALAPAFGAYPVPLVGMGVSPILGAWLGFGVLMGMVRRHPV